MKLSDFQSARVVTEDGRVLGHVFDLRSPGPPDEGGGAGREVTALVFGTLGWLERIGLRHAHGSTLAWDLVRRMRGRDFIVDRSVRVVHKAEPV